MSWHCRQCNLATPIADETCRSCQQSWKKVWQKPKQRSASRQRSAARDPKGKKQQKENKDKATKPADSPLLDPSLFPARVPWVPTTPQARMTGKQAEVPGSAELGSNLPIPPQPILPAPPVKTGQADTLSAEEAEALQHLKGLGKLGVSLPPELMQQLEALQAREREAQPVLSHMHLNRLKKIQNQLQGIARKIGQVDADWQAFADTVSQRIREHSSWYQNHRAELVQQFNAKSEELNAVKAEVSQASQTLVGQTAAMEPAQPPLDTQQDAANLTQMLLTTQGVPFIALDEQDEPDEAMSQGPEAKEDVGSPKSDQGAPAASKERSKPSLRPAAFSVARSPTRVQQPLLKPKKET